MLPRYAHVTGLPGKKFKEQKATGLFVNFKGVLRQMYSDPTLIGDTVDTFEAEFDVDNVRVFGKPTGAEWFEETERTLPRCAVR